MKEDRTHFPRERTGCSGEPAYLLGESGAGLYTDGASLFLREQIRVDRATNDPLTIA